MPVNAPLLTYHRSIVPSVEPTSICDLLAPVYEPLPRIDQVNPIWPSPIVLQTGSEVDVIKPAPVGSRQAGLVEQIGNAAVEAIMDVLRDGRFSAVPGHLPRPASRIRRT